MSETSLIEQEKLYWMRQAADFEKELTQAEARILELEANMKAEEEAHAILQRGYEQCIAKAKAILEHHHVHPGEGNICPACRALEALEGK